MLELKSGKVLNSKVIRKIVSKNFTDQTIHSNCETFLRIFIQIRNRKVKIKIDNQVCLKVSLEYIQICLNDCNI